MSILHKWTVREYTNKCAPICKYNVICVDDENFNLLVTYGMLVGFGCKPLMCKSGAQALTYFKEKYNRTCCYNKIDLVLTDIQMPEMDGYKFTQCLRSVEAAWSQQLAKQGSYGKKKANRRIPVIAVTCVTDNPNHFEKARQVGIDNTWGKPLMMPQVGEILRHYFFNDHRQEQP